jgi:hypothetical protein
LSIRFEPGAVILKQGAKNYHMFRIKNGEAQVIIGVCFCFVVVVVVVFLVVTDFFYMCSKWLLRD